MYLHYKKHKRAKTGPCNICGKHRPLSWDHVPPQGGIELEAVEIDRLAGVLASGLAAQQPALSQNGLKYRTICSNCNSLLGRKFDPALNDFAISVGRLLKSRLVFPDIVHIEARPTAIARAVLGHLLAARLSADDAFFDAIIRKLLLDQKAPIPLDLNIFYWVYPYAHQIVFREGMMPTKRGDFSEFQRFGVLKYFPIGYLVSDSHEYEGLESLTLWRNESCTQAVNLPIRLKEIREPFWPESPAPDNFLMVGQEGIESVKAQPRKLKS